MAFFHGVGESVWSIKSISSIQIHQFCLQNSFNKSMPSDPTSSYLVLQPPAQSTFKPREDLERTGRNYEDQNLATLCISVQARKPSANKSV